MSCRKMAKTFGMTYNTFRYRCYTNNIVFDVYKNKGKSELFDNITSPSISYFLGFLWADGYIKNNGAAIEIEILSDDASDIKREICGVINYREYHRKRGENETTAITIGDKHLVSLLVEKFGFDKKSALFMKTDFIPTNLIKYFLRGYLDGDGYVGKTKIQFSAPYDYDWTHFISVLVMLGISDYKIRKYISSKNHKSSSMIINHKHDSKKLLDFIYEGRGEDRIGLGRKYDKYLEYY